MKKGNATLLIISMLSAEPALARCVLDTTPLGGGTPTTLQIPAFTIHVDADAPADRSKPIGSMDSSRGGMVSFLCDRGEMYGKSVFPPLSGRATQNKMFATNIDGLEIMPLWNNGAAFGKFPSIAAVGANRINYPSQSYFRIELYKTKPQLKLTDPDAGDVLLDGGTIAYNWINSDSSGDIAQRLNIGQIHIISTPVCRVDGKKTIDFNTVSSDNISNGVSRPLNFAMACTTDYGSYSATAKLTTSTPTSDNNYIQVTDNAGNTDRLKIRIDDSKGSLMHVDGTNAEIIKGTGNNIPAQFKWTATLLKGPAQSMPARGQFSANAEIILQLN